MPTYTYYCGKCKNKFELFSYIKDYKESPTCPNCSSTKTERSYMDDYSSVQSSIIKHDSELKTVGDLANRNRDKLSEDHKQELYDKHNNYKETPVKPLPKGMSRVKKQPKIKWT